jgi:hypothetical protein
MNGDPMTSSSLCPRFVILVGPDRWAGRTARHSITLPGLPQKLPLTIDNLPLTPALSLGRGGQLPDRWDNSMNNRHHPARDTSHPLQRERAGVRGLFSEGRFEGGAESFSPQSEVGCQ